MDIQTDRQIYMQTNFPDISRIQAVRLIRNSIVTDYIWPEALISTKVKKSNTLMAYSTTSVSLDHYFCTIIIYKGGQVTKSIIVVYHSSKRIFKNKLTSRPYLISKLQCCMLVIGLALFKHIHSNTNAF